MTQQDTSTGVNGATEAVLLKSEPMPENSISVGGYNFEEGPVDYDKLMASYFTTGFQATNLGKAVQIVNKMVNQINLIKI
jgi:deoxyhypusine synthase